MFPRMSFIADTHVHVYPSHDPAAALRGAMSRLAALAPGSPRVLCLTERHDCHFFRGRREPPESGRREAEAGGHVRVVRPLPPPFSCVPAGPHALAISDHAGERLFVVAGRQVATAERLEVHCLGRDADIPDGLPLAEAIGRVRAAGGVAVIPWGVGKWLGRRGRLVLDALAGNPDVFAGDSSLRPALWPERVFSAYGARMLCGSDPLPAPGEEGQAGRYATIFDAPFDEGDPAASLLDALRRGAPRRPAGLRCGPLEVLRRMRNMRRTAP